jgi:tetratricopeptide (TPR) repeat protein
MNRNQCHIDQRDADQVGHLVMGASETQSSDEPACLTSLYAEVVKRQNAGQLAETVALYDRMVLLKPDVAEMHVNRGVALAGVGRLEEAAQSHYRAIALNSDLADAYNHLGDVLSRLGRLGAAEEALLRAVSLRPHFAEALCNLGNTFQRQARHAEAEAAYRRAISLKPDYPQAHNNLSNTLLDLGRLEEAEHALRQAIALFPRLPEAHSNLGNVLRARGRLAESEASCRNAVALNPNYAEAHCNLGSALKDQGRLVEAEVAYRKAIALMPDFAIAYNNLGATLKDMGRLAEARQAVEEAIALEPCNPLYWLNLCDAKRFVVGDPHVSAMEKLTRDIQSSPDRPQIELHFALAKAYDDIGEWEASYRELQAGNAMKRRHVVYDEGAMMELFHRVETVFTPELVRSRGGGGEGSSRPIFIVGMPRSGTTLVEQILASHPKVHGAGELPVFGDLVDRTMSSHVGPAYPEAMSTLSRERLQQFGNNYVSALLELAPSAERVTDKLLSNFLYLGLVHLALPNARIVDVVRDPIDTCWSCFSKLFDGLPFTYDLAELGRYYRAYRRLMEHWHRVLPPGTILTLHYESVVADLDGEARRLIAHCGLPWNERCLSFHETARPVRTASATQVRQPIYRSAIGRARFHEQFLAPLRAALGA